MTAPSSAHSPSRRNRNIALLVAAVIIIILLLLMRCAKEPSATSTGGGRGAAAAAAAAAGKKGGGGNSPDVKSGGAGAEALPEGAGKTGELVDPPPGEPGGGKGSPDLLAVDKPGPVAKAPPREHSLLAGALPVTLEGFGERDLDSGIVGKDKHSVVPALADWAEARFHQTTAAGPKGWVALSVHDGIGPPSFLSPAEEAAIRAGKPKHWENEQKDFEHTSLRDGHVVSERFFTSGRKGTLQFTVAGRFHVTVSTYDLPAEMMWALAQRIDLALLTRLAATMPKPPGSTE